MEGKPGQKIEWKDYKKFIPLDKSWIIRMGVLDLVHGYRDINDFLKKQKDLGDDLLALKRAAEVWNTDEPIDVGESGTLYRILQFISWQLDLNKKFITRIPTERLKRMPNDPNIVNLSLREIRALPDNTSQRVTAALLMGRDEPIPEDFDYKIRVTTVEAIKHWHERREQGKVWEPIIDETIKAQAEAFLQMLKGEKVSFTPQQSEDYCFARAFGFMTKEEGDRLWSNLKGNESPRTDEMEKVMAQAEAGQPIDSKDHRVIQAMAMWGAVHKKKLEFTNPEAVNKSWPLFWEFLNSVHK
jgi:hypothetical protein